MHTESDLRLPSLAWCSEAWPGTRLAALAARHLEFVQSGGDAGRSLRSGPSTLSRLPPVSSRVGGRVKRQACVIDGVSEQTRPPTNVLRPQRSPPEITDPLGFPPAVRGAAQPGPPASPPSSCATSPVAIARASRLGIFGATGHRPELLAIAANCHNSHHNAMAPGPVRGRGRAPRCGPGLPQAERTVTSARVDLPGRPCSPKPQTEDLRRSPYPANLGGNVSPPLELPVSEPFTASRTRGSPFWTSPHRLRVILLTVFHPRPAVPRRPGGGPRRLERHRRICEAEHGPSHKVVHPGC